MFERRSSRGDAEGQPCWTGLEGKRHALRWLALRIRVTHLQPPRRGLQKDHPPVGQSVDDWQRCDACAALLESGDWQRLT